MSTNLEIIRDSLAMLGIVNEIKQPTAEQSELGLRILNETLEEWAADGINVGQWPQSDLAAEWPGPFGAIPAVKYALANALGPYYGTMLAPPDVQRAERFYSRLIRDTVKANMVESDLTGTVPQGEGQYGRFNILTG